MATRQFSEIINRPINDVFTYSTDPEKLAKWGEGIQEVEMTSDGPLGVGTTYIVKNKMGGQIQEFKNEVIVYQPPRKFAFRTGGGAFGDYTSTRTFDDLDGKTRVTETIDTEGPSGILKILMPLIIIFIKKSHHGSLIRLKEILESQK